jgi:catechol 2,3-dioxygenase
MVMHRVSNDSFIINPLSRIDHVHLRVSNLQESINFYQSILGFEVLVRKPNDKTAFLASRPNNDEKDRSSPLLVLTEVNNNNRISSSNKIRKEAGLYHFAILLPGRKFLGMFLQHLTNNLDSKYHEGMADHGVSESIYIHDPDFNGIEIYRDRSPSEWKWNNNKVYMVTNALNVEELLSQDQQAIWSGLPSNTSIGHVHLHVSNLLKAKRFYQNTLGLYHTASYPGAYFFAADSYHHHVATNTWIGTNISPADHNHNKPGLDHYAIVLPNVDELNRLRNHFIQSEIFIDETILELDAQYHRSFYAYDPDRIKVQFLCK